MTTQVLTDLSTHAPVTPAERAQIEQCRARAEHDWRGRFDHVQAQTWYWRAVELARARRDQLVLPIEHGGGKWKQRERT